jgi:hypothetical protein
MKVTALETIQLGWKRSSWASSPTSWGCVYAPHGPGLGTEPLPDLTTRADATVRFSPLQ